MNFPSANLKILLIWFFTQSYIIYSVLPQNRNIVVTLLQFLQQGQADLNLENNDNNVKWLKQYDFIVVGAGTAGCTLAARLSENPNWNVLLLEAGGPETRIMDVPILAHFLQLGEMNWKYRTQATGKECLAMNNNRCNWPRGKVMGGSSVLNYMMYTRGNRRDYDRWAELGNEGWSYRDVLPYFKKLEGSTVPNAEADYVGRNGPVKVSYVNWRSTVADAFVNAAQQDGLKYRDYNGRIQTGVSYLQTTTYQGKRWSSNRAYLYPIKGKRPNLHVRKYSLVTKILIDPDTKTAYGVIVSSGDKSYKVLAAKEVILTAGAINTPQLMMLSGIGPAKHLREIGIKPLVNLAVGYNLQDHFAPAITFTTNVSTLHLPDLFDVKHMSGLVEPKGPYGSPGGCESIAFWALDDPNSKDGWPDIELFQLAAGMNSNPAVQRAFGIRQDVYEALYNDIVRENQNVFMIFPMILRPKSRGRILLKSKDAFKYPLIFANSMAHPYDLDIAVRGILKTISLENQPAFKQINAKLLEKGVPACMRYGYKTLEYWQCYAKHFTLTIYHYAGTAKMGPSSDPSAVVDARLRVYGVKNLRVADASIMPELIAGHPNGPVFMIAEKAADMIKEDYNFI